MKLLLLIISSFFVNSFQQIGISEEGDLKAMVFNKDEKTLLYLSVDQSENVDSLIIKTDIWRIVLERSSFTDECIFEINSAEAAVLKKDLINTYEVIIDGESTRYQSTDPTYIRNKLAGYQF